MPSTLIAKVSIVINVPVARVWDALTNPEMIKQYMFGTDVTTDWKVGSTITYTGVWEGKAYEDKGKILEIVPEQRLVSTYWSSMGGKPDAPENYNTVTYELASEAIPTSVGTPLRSARTRLTILQDNIATDTEREHSEKNWGMVLESVKKLLEK